VTQPVRIDASPVVVAPRPLPSDAPACDRCGGETWWRSCKLLCKQCHAIVMSCGDL